MDSGFILADDLTGACDAGVQFTGRGFPVTVWLDVARAGQGLSVITTASRNDPPALAREKVRQVCRRLGAPLFKKIDSTLQGNVGQEVAAVMEEAGLRSAIVAPAFPAMGRVVREGWLEAPGGRIHLPSLLAEQGVPPGVVEVPEIATDDDLARLARRALATSPRPLLVGSAGLARALADQLWPRVDLRDTAQVRATVFIIGSTNPVTRAQADRLAARPEVEVFRVGDGQGERRRLAGFLATFRERPPRGILVTGGDTAALVFELLGAEGMRLESELLTGIPWGRLIGGQADGLAVVTKAGGFGTEDALLAAAGAYED